MLNRVGDQFVQRTKVLHFRDKMYISWQPAIGPLPQGWVEEADGTLRVQCQPEHLGKEVEYETSPVYPGASPNLFSYEEQFELDDTSALFHLVLVPRYLPRLESIQPFPTYARPEGERFVMGWTWRSGVWFSFLFEAVSPETFNTKADILRRAVVKGQHAALNDEEELGSIGMLLSTWQSNLRFLEQQAALYGLNVPVRLHNELEHAKEQIAALGKRIADIRSRA